jgi:5'-phosphate synthase pdxT subunit
MAPPAIGVLALQGAFTAHTSSFREVGLRVCEIRRVADLEGVDGLMIPGGESTTLLNLMQDEPWFDRLRQFHDQGGVLAGTCAGAILLAREVENHPVRTLGLIDAIAVRNAYGTQVDSFATEAEAAPPLEGLRCVFIRAPRLRRPGPDLEVLARVDGWPVCVRQGRVLATTFHPELTDDPRIHCMLLELAGGPGG